MDELKKQSNGQEEVEAPSELNDPSYLRIINSTVLPDLGNLNQVFFDKTDTLTSGKMKVAEVSTYMKCYKVPNTGFETMISDCMVNPDTYSYEEDIANLFESGDYSEKSQE